VSALRVAGTLALVTVLGLILSTVLVALIQGPDDALPALSSFVDGVAGSPTAIGATGKTLTPILLIGVAACLAFRAGLFDVGQVGQFLMGGVAAGAVAPIVPGPGAIVIVATLLAGALAGAIWSTLVSRLAVITGLELVVLSLVANYLADGLARLATSTVLQDPEAYSVTRTRPVPTEAWLPTLLPRTSLHAGILLALAAVAVSWVVLTRTAVGHRLTMFGRNPSAAALAGVDPVRFPSKVLGVTGAVCGAAGAIEVLGVYHGYQDATLGGANSIAWTGLTAAFLVPAGLFALVPVSTLLAALVTGFAGIQRDLGIPTGLGTLLAGIVVIAAAFSVRSPRGDRGARAAKANADSSPARAAPQVIAPSLGARGGR
jgi:general nucleoside transport system permease protein